MQPIADWCRLQLFFQTVQGFLPLLHRPSIYAEFLDPKNGQQRNYGDINIASAILLNSMFALSARFSEWNQCWTTEPKDRGAAFASKAKTLWREHVKDDEEPSLRLLQSRILMAYYELTSGPSFQAWQSTGICCRMAYGLSLHRTDRETGSISGSGDGSKPTWVDQEERRRAWWAVFQLDNCISIIACRPFNLDSSNMDVLLPVSDDDWFCDRGTKSVAISPRGPSDAWASLRNCENQDPYAWFIVANELLRACQKIYDRNHRSVEELNVIDSALSCFALALPPSCRLTPANMVFDEYNYVEKNWNICTTILLQS
jgi:hypothetical protein